MRKAAVLTSFLLVPWLSPAFAGADTKDSTVPIPASGRPLDVVLLIDSSPSTRTTDPEGDRYRAAGFLVDYLAVLGDLAGVNHRIAMGNFGATVGQIVPLQWIHSSGVERLIGHEEIPGTDFRPALEFARRELLPAVSGDRVPVVVLFTDGQPGREDGRSLRGEELRDYFERRQPPDLPWQGHSLPEVVLDLQSLGTEVFVVGLNKNPEVAELWAEILPTDHYIEIGEVSNLAWAYHSLFSDLLGLQGVSEYRVFPGQETLVELSPLLSEAVFVFLAAGKGPTEVTSPNGAPLPMSAGGGPGEIHQLFVAWEPGATGAWRATVAEAEATLIVIERPSQLIVERLPETLQLGESLMIRAAVMRHGRPLTGVGKLSVVARLSGAEGVPATTELAPEPHSSWFQGTLDPRGEAGVQELQVMVTHDDRQMHALQFRAKLEVRSRRGWTRTLGATSRRPTQRDTALIAALLVFGTVLTVMLVLRSWSHWQIRRRVRVAWQARGPLRILFNTRALAALGAYMRRGDIYQQRDNFRRARSHEQPEVRLLAKRVLIEILRSGRHPDPIELLFSLDRSK